MKQNTIILTALGLLVAGFLAGCGSQEVRNEFVSQQKIDGLDSNRFEYVADIVLNREGYNFLWFIPFASASEESAKAIIWEETKKRYKDAAGVYEVEMRQQGVGLFDWRPSTTLWGKIVVQKRY